MVGPYKIINQKIAYTGNNINPSISDVSTLVPKKEEIENRWNKLLNSDESLINVIKIYDELHFIVTKFMRENNVQLFNLPVLTRMISSPGALEGTIISDVDPFKISFFDQEAFLTQSSQLYLEFAIMSSKINHVFCWDKSFRNEKSDFRHLPEFTHVEFEANISFNECLEFQTMFL